MGFLLIVIISLIVVTTFGTIYYSIMKRKTEGVKRQLYQAWMNIHMGFLFISIALFLLLTPDYRLWRLILIALIMILGMINLFYGIKFKRFFTNQLQKKTNNS
ncbi:YtpI family protein [Thermoflavimicrobium daqui]|jgi:hypothetical protein|uniref:YtpI-like protein n=1 Tax=Thermoflavimicrobium daqui TaxID=2137476 RepID=A0A364K977_9BACL|nr:YtpI family protein [Thermoflavimicrobium daqui]RAL26849.1 hypothetical protein DL897_02025 [Thermoflavimicrobium daqui]